MSAVQWEGLKIPNRAHRDSVAEYCTHPMITLPQFDFAIPGNAKDLLLKYCGHRYQFKGDDKEVLVDNLVAAREWVNPDNDTMFRLCVEACIHHDQAHTVDVDWDEGLQRGIQTYQNFYTFGLGRHRWPAIFDRLLSRRLVSVTPAASTLSNMIQIPRLDRTIQVSRCKLESPLFGSTFAANELLQLDGHHFDLIWDEQQVMDFLNIIKPTNPRFGTVISLFARPKYDPFLLDQQILQRVFVAAADPVQSGLRKIKRMNVPRDCYCVGDTLVDPSALCLYACAVPKDPIKALTSAAQQATLMALNVADRPYRQTDQDAMEEAIESEPGPDHGTRMDSAHKLYEKILDATGKFSPWAHIDVDTKDAANLALLRSRLEDTGVWGRIVATVETRSGYHILYKSDKDFDKSLVGPFKEFKYKYSRMKTTNKLGQACTDYWFMPNHHNMVQLPGSWQAGTWRVRLVDANTQWPPSQVVSK